LVKTFQELWIGSVDMRQSYRAAQYDDVTFVTLRRASDPKA